MGNYILKLCYALLFILLPSAQLLIHGFNSTSRSKEIKCKDSEREALLRFKQGLQDDYDMLFSWRDDDKLRDCCKWKGIGCSNKTGQVNMLDLHAGFGTHSFTGAINLSLMIDLKNIKYLDLSWNYFLGSYIPELIGSFSKLRYLYISSSGFSGRIPNQLGKLKNLKYLDMRYNELEGKIPHELGKLSHLKYLNIEGNKLVGEIPCALGNLAQLQYLNLGGNSLAGAIPYQLGNLAQLQFLDLEGNFLDGTIPFKIGELWLLQSLRLGRNYNLKINKKNYGDAKCLSSLSYLKNLDLSSFNIGHSHHWLQVMSKILPNLRELKVSSDCDLSDINIVPLFDSFNNISSSLTILDMSSNMLTSLTFKWLFNFSSNLNELLLSFK